MGATSLGTERRAIRTVFFDFGGTLAHTLSSFEGVAETWRRTATELGFDVSTDRVRAALDRVRRTFRTEPYGFVGRSSEYWTLYDGAVLAELGIPGRPEEWERRLSAVFQDPRHLALYPEVRGVLDGLREEGLQLGVISNYMDDLPGIVRRLGLGDVLSTVTFSQEAGAEKPDPRPFDLALQRAGCARSEALHVGDSFEADYLGASRAGLQALWLNRDARPPPLPCAEVRDLTGVRVSAGRRP